jgi:ferredoxin
MRQTITFAAAAAVATGESFPLPRSLRVDPIACDGHGLCAELLPELIRLDDWGFPIVDKRPLPAGLEPQARQAVRACPKLALRLSEG